MSKVLIIDDDKNLLNMLSIFLSRQGWEVLSASDGTQGLKLAHEGRPDVLLCDVVLPDMDGFNILKSLRGAPDTADLPVVLLSGTRKDAEDVLAGLDGDGQGYLTKPIDLRLVHAKLQAVLRAGER